MNVKQLAYQGEDETELYECGSCGLLYSPKRYAVRRDMAHDAAYDAADQCCKQKFCSCGVPVDSGYTACSSCRLAKRLSNASQIDQHNYSGPVYCDEGEGEWGEGYSSCVSAALEYFDCDDMPAYLFPCTDQRLHLNAEQILESATDDMHEDACDQIVDGYELCDFIEKWNARQTCVTYYKDFSRVIVLDADRFRRLCGER